MPIETPAVPEVVAPVDVPLITEPTAAAPAEPVANAEPKTDPAPEPDANAAEDARQKGIQKRIDRLTREKYEERAQRIAAERLLEIHSAPKQENPQDGRPEQKNFETAEDFVEALTDWKLEQREQKSKAQDAQKSQQTAMQKRDAIFSEAQKLGNFDADEFAENVKITGPMADAILDPDLDVKVAGKLIHHLNSNPDEAFRIAGLSPARQQAEIHQLEVKLSTVAPKVSKAPPPIDPIGGGKAAIDSLETDDMAAYIALRKKQGARWAR